MKLLSALFALFLVTGCGVGSAEVGADGLEQSGAELKIPSENFGSTVDVGSWNVEWFGSAGLGPSNDALQLTNVTRVLKETNLDVVGLVEVVSETAFAQVLENLPAHSGILVTDPRVISGKNFYSAAEQKVALVFRKRFTVQSARVVMTEQATAFGGRPPMEVTLSFVEDGQPRTLVVVVAHLKALATLDGYSRRKESAAAIAQFLEKEHPTDFTLVVGDFNDDLDVSTYQKKPSPFLSLVSEFQFTTAELSASNTSTTTGFSATIDHHLATKALGAHYVEGSAKVLRPDSFIAGYKTNTSDHYPVITRYFMR